MSPGEPSRRLGPVATLLLVALRELSAASMASSSLAAGSTDERGPAATASHSDYQMEQQEHMSSAHKLSAQTNSASEIAAAAAATTTATATPTNTTTPSEESMKFPLYMRLIATLACLVIFTIGVCGNLLVPLVVIKTRYLRNSTNLFLINLSIADLLVLIVCMPTVLIELHSRPETWPLGEPMCKLSNFVEMLAANGSIFTILAISFERYYAICKPLKAGYKCTRLRATIIICLIWLLSSILTSPILIMAKSSETIYIDGSLVYNCILETDTYWHKMYVFVSMFAFFCLPLLVLMLVYWLISIRLIRENIAMKDTTRNHLIDRHGSLSPTETSDLGTPSIRRRRVNLSRSSPLRRISSFFASVGQPHIGHVEKSSGSTNRRQTSKGQRGAHDRTVRLNSMLVTQSHLAGPQAKIAPPDGRLVVNKALSLDCPRVSDLSVFKRANQSDRNGAAIDRPSWSHTSTSNRSDLSHQVDVTVDGVDSVRTNPQERLLSCKRILALLLEFRGRTKQVSGKDNESGTILNGHSEDGHNCLREEPIGAGALIDEEKLITFKKGGAVITACDADSMGAMSCPTDRSGGSNPFGKEVDSREPFLQNQTKKACASSPHEISHESVGFKQPKSPRAGRRRLAASKKREGRGISVAGYLTRSEFRWAKEFSASLSTGFSTRTNSTNLPSETSPKSPSLNDSVPYSSSPRPTTINEGGTPNKGEQARRKCAHFGACEKGADLATRSSQTRAATTSTTSYSSSASCDVDNISERSSSPASLSTAPDISKSSPLDSLAFREPRRQLSQIADEGHPSLDGGEEQFSCNERGVASGMQIRRECAAPAPAIAEREAARPGDASYSCDSSSRNFKLPRDYAPAQRSATLVKTDADDNVSAGRTSGCDKGSRARRMLRSLTEDRPLRERAKLMAMHSALDAPKHFRPADADRPSDACLMSSTSVSSKHTSRVNLIAMAHNLSDNLHFKRTGPRSGSQPLVANHLHASELLVVRDMSKKQQMDSRRQVVVMLAFVVACFFLLFFPYRVFTIWLILSTEDQVQSLGMETYYNLTYFSRILIYLHSAINPIAYNLISTKFRRAFMSILLWRGSATRRNFIAETHQHRNGNGGGPFRERGRKNGSVPTTNRQP